MNAKIKVQMFSITPKARLRIRKILVQVAMIIFFADMIAQIWPAFGHVWAQPWSHTGVSIAAFLAILAESLASDGGEY